MTPPPALHAAPARHAEAALRVALVAEDAVTARRATRALEADGIVVSADGRIPDVVVLACDISRTPNTSTLRRLRREHGEVGIVVVATGSRHGNVHETVNMGADGFLLETELESTLAVVVRAISLGHVTVRPAPAAALPRPARLLPPCARDPGARHGGPAQPRDRRPPVPGREHGQEPRRLVAGEARRALAQGGGGPRPRSGRGPARPRAGRGPEGPRPVQALRPQA